MATEKNTGGAAFPVIVSRDVMTGNGNVVTVREPEGGMSLRDYFAAKAMAAMLTSGNGMAPYETDDPEQASSLAYLAYKAADAMLAERAK